MDILDQLFYIDDAIKVMKIFLVLNNLVDFFRNQIGETLVSNRPIDSDNALLYTAATYAMLAKVFFFNVYCYSTNAASAWGAN